MADKQERTEEASPRKREEARSEGQLARSQEIPMAFGLFAALMSLRVGAGDMFVTFERVTQYYLRLIGDWPREELTVQRIQQMTGAGYEFLLDLMLPLFIALMVTGLLSNLIQTGPFISIKPMMPKWSRISLGRGFGALFSQRSVVEAGKSWLKVLVLAVLAWRIIARRLPTIISLPQAGWEPVLPMMGDLVYRLALTMVLAFLILAAIDYTYQRWQYNQNLKMSKEEVKEEMKQYEGDPQVKARIRSIQRDLARRRMMKNVPKASVVITNPHEIAVALEYDRETMTAPRVVAKGERLIAQRIKEIAREHDVPIVEDRPLAQALFREVPLGAEITANFYKALAEVLAYVYRLRRPPVRPVPVVERAAAGGAS
jgi:flagellar biosynthetic protein FlhB